MIINTGDLNTINPKIAITCPKTPNKKPIVTAFGEPNPYTAAQSTAGIEPGNNLLEIPWNASDNSATNKRTPNCKICT